MTRLIAGLTLSLLAASAGEAITCCAVAQTPAAGSPAARSEDGLELIAPADPDLERIPQDVKTANPPDGAANQSSKIYLQDDLAFYGFRNSLVVPPPQPKGSNWKDLFFLDARTQWPLSHDVYFTYSGRLNVEAAEGQRFFQKTSFRNDLREAYLSFDLPDQSFLEIGRVNLKSGVALGFNPTDFFKTRAVVEPLSADPSVLREDRLGALMAEGEHVASWGALTLAFAPRLERPTAIYTAATLPSLDPVFDRTNASNRYLAKASFNLPADFSPEVLYYGDGSHHAWGLNLTRGFGQSIVGYLEWAGETRASLIDDALGYGRETGTLPPTLPSPIPESPARAFRSDLATGLTYTTPNKITLSLEYQRHDAGFSSADWSNWFAAGARGNPNVDAELWYIRGYAGDQREPTARNSVFLRADRQDAFIRNLELTGFISLDAGDGSGITQITADYYLSRQWTIGGLVSTTFGGRRTDFGSLAGAANFLVKASLYF